MREEVERSYTLTRAEIQEAVGRYLRGVHNVDTPASDVDLQLYWKGEGNELTVVAKFYEVASWDGNEPKTKSVRP